jgi:thiol-disulfide isomerase/thioredoxin
VDLQRERVTKMLALVLALATAVPATAAPAPRVGISSFSDLPTPLPFPFNASLDADKLVDAALLKAKAEHKRVFIDLGGNWCGDCRLLAALMNLPEVQPFIGEHYVVVSIDIGRFNRNMQIPARWGAVAKLQGMAPAILIVDPDKNILVNDGQLTVLEDSRHMDPQRVVDHIAAWAK